jgi:hypothetical protein
LPPPPAGSFTAPSIKKLTQYSALVTALSTVGAAHGSFKYHPEWECGCNLGRLLEQRAEEAKQKQEEEWARLQRNKAAKAVFDSGDVPRSSPLWQKLDAFGYDFDYFFISGRHSCARTVVRLKLPLPGGPELFLQSDTSELNGAAIHDQGVKLTKGFLRGGWRIKEVAVSYRPRTAPEGKKIRWSDDYDAVKTLLRLRLGR